MTLEKLEKKHWADDFIIDSDEIRTIQIYDYDGNLVTKYNEKPLKVHVEKVYSRISEDHMIEDLDAILNDTFHVPDEE